MRRLILNADDFGLTPGVNLAVEELCAAQALTSATLMARGAAFEGAVAIAKRQPSLGVGCHVVLVDGSPVSAPDKVPTLIGPDGKNFHATLGGFVRALVRHRIDAADIEREADAQIAKLRDAGVGVTHIDTHKHTHMFPAVLRPLLRVADEHRIAAIRNPFEPAWSLRCAGGSLLRRAEIALLRGFEKQFRRAVENSNCATTDGALGILATGTLDIDAIERMLQAMPEGTWELVCHPGHIDAQLGAINTRLRRSREIEFEALGSVFSSANLNHPEIELIHYGMLGSRSREVL